MNTTFLFVKRDQLTSNVVKKIYGNNVYDVFVTTYDHMFSFCYNLTDNEEFEIMNFVLNQSKNIKEDNVIIKFFSGEYKEISFKEVWSMFGMINKCNINV